jgi:hypothetical protein
MGFLDEVKKAVPRPQGGNGQDLGKAAAGALGNIFGGKAREAVQPAADGVAKGINETANTANNWLKVKGTQLVISTQFPDALPLGQSKGMNQFVENGLSALGHFSGKPDGKPDQKTLEAVNKLRESGGQEPLTSVDQFGKSDLKLMVDKLAEKGTPHSQTVLNSATDTLGGLKKDYPKPVEPAPAADTSYSPGG